jgi:hypothetical protein
MDGDVGPGHAKYPQLLQSPQRHLGYNIPVQSSHGRSLRGNTTKTPATRSTNTITYDFETSEHLYVLEADRDIESYPIVNMASCGPTSIQIPNSYGFDASEDSYTKVAEIPQKMRWTRIFPWPRLKHGYTWRVPRKLDDPRPFTVLMPGAQGQTAILPGTRITQLGEILADQTTKSPTATYVRNNIQDRQLPETSSRPIKEISSFFPPPSTFSQPFIKRHLLKASKHVYTRILPRITFSQFALSKCRSFLLLPPSHNLL